MPSWYAVRAFLTAITQLRLVRANDLRGYDDDPTLYGDNPTTDQCDIQYVTVQGVLGPYRAGTCVSPTCRYVRDIFGN